MEKKDKANSYLYFFKCQNQECRLEFVVFSWDDNWSEKHKPYCPECGEQKASLIHRATSDKQINELVYSKWWV